MSVGWLLVTVSQTLDVAAKVMGKTTRSSQLEALHHSAPVTAFVVEREEVIDSPGA